MRHTTLIILLFALTVSHTTLRAQQLSNNWAVRNGSTAVEHALAVTADSKGNLYVTGGVQTAGPGDTEIFLSKYGADGHPIWSFTSGSDTLIYNEFTEFGTDVLAVGEDVYVTGTFLSQADFSGTQIKSHGYDDIFLAKYSSFGELLWIKSAGGTSQDLVYSMAADKDGNVYITGSFQREAKFEDRTIVARNSTDMFVAKYDPYGNLAWVQQTQSDVEGVGKKIRCEEGRCMIAGEYRGAVEFEGTLVADEQNKVMLTTISQVNGTVLDNNIVFSQPNVSVNDFILENGSIYMTGSFSQTLALYDTLIFSKGGSDGYLVKMDASGKQLWAVSHGGPFFDKGQSISSDKKGRIMLVGSFQKELQMSDSPIRGFDADDIFMSTITSDGVVSGVEVYGGPGIDKANDSEMIDGSVVIAGYFRDVAKIRDFSLQSAGSSDMLLAKLPLKPLNVKQASEAGSEIVVKVYPNPAKGKFTVSAVSGDINEIGISNTLGQELSNFKITRLSSREAEVRTDVDFHGVCIVKGIAGQERFVYKVIIE